MGNSDSKSRQNEQSAQTPQNPDSAKAPAKPEKVSTKPEKASASPEKASASPEKASATRKKRSPLGSFRKLALTSSESPMSPRSSLRNLAFSSSEPSMPSPPPPLGDPILRASKSFKFEPGGEKGSRAADWLSQTPPAVYRPARHVSATGGETVGGGGSRSNSPHFARKLFLGAERKQNGSAGSSKKGSKGSQIKEWTPDKSKLKKGHRDRRHCSVSSVEFSEDEEISLAEYQPIEGLRRLKEQWGKALSTRFETQKGDEQQSKSLENFGADIEEVLQKARSQKIKAGPVGHSQTIRLGNWRLGKYLGTGVLGRVFLARDEMTGGLMAVRVVKVDKNSRGIEALTEMQLYVDSISRLQHPNIVGYLGAEITEDFLFIYEEYIPGGSLNKLLGAFPGKQNENIISTYVRQMLEGLAYLHKNGITHHDMNSYNVLVGDGGQLRLHDFGLFKYINNFPDGLSSPGYREHRKVSSNPLLLPSGLRMQMGMGATADIWGLGCIVIHLLTGQPPWDIIEVVEDGITELRILNANDPPTIPTAISQPFKDFLTLCFHRDPELRPTAQHLLNHPFVKLKDNNIAIEEPSYPLTFELSTPNTPECHSPASNGLTPTSPRQNWDDVPVGNATAVYEHKKERIRHEAIQKHRLDQKSAFQREQYENKSAISNGRSVSTPPRTETMIKKPRRTYPVTRQTSKTKDARRGSSSTESSDTMNRKKAHGRVKSPPRDGHLIYK